MKKCLTLLLAVRSRSAAGAGEELTEDRQCGVQVDSTRTQTRNTKKIVIRLWRCTCWPSTGTACTI